MKFIVLIEAEPTPQCLVPGAEAEQAKAYAFAFNALLNQMIRVADTTYGLRLTITK